MMLLVFFFHISSVRITGKVKKKAARILSIRVAFDSISLGLFTEMRKYVEVLQKIILLR